ncbi:MAG: TVP38/TMEM64 family protein [Desulfobacterium sp.]|nr:TVP38/TMEM64 family protein [Desulfobacterium sp.]MBU3947689.1 VTT domain-containing protein [Pseudomonadota bacterium]MBU4037387.1 VTT domain-containing protein [Pseudomonadota bacterium]
MTNLRSHKFKILFGICLLAIAVLIYIFRTPLWNQTLFYWNLFSDREQIKAFITSFGIVAPIAFIAVQVLQVIFAPIPGEATGFIGGYIFGALQGFIYSSIGLGLGSWINFLIGRFLGKHYIRKIVPTRYLDKFDSVIKHQGVMVLFVLFVFPGFPKDYLCMFLGLSALPIKVFILLATIGRMPGTLMLSFQGASLYDKSYGAFTIITVICIIFLIIGYRYRNVIYNWVDKLNNK